MSCSVWSSARQWLAVEQAGIVLQITIACLSMLRHAAMMMIDVLCQRMLQPKKKNKDKRVVVACNKLAQGVAKCFDVSWCVRAG